jgi:peptidoglycan/xylan/chitin deacetylase (PgdA/CDA1 family)
MRRFLVLVAAASAVLATATPVSAADVGVTITAPTAGAVVSGIVSVAASTTGTVISVAFDLSTDADATWAPIATDTTPADGWTATWDTAGFSGPAALRATATADASVAIATVDVVVDNTLPTITATASPPAFSPNGDGAKDQTTITVGLYEPASLTAEVLALDGSVVRSLVSEAPVQAGETDLPWDGTNGRGQAVTDGPYTVRIEAVDALSDGSTASVPVIVDTRRPGFRWRGASPEPITRIGRVTFAFRASDRATELAVSFSIADTLGRRVGGRSRPLPSGSASTLSWNARHENGDPVDPGLYHVTFSVTDDAGNARVTRPFPFRDHRPVTTRVWRRVDGAGKRVALTFDDCYDTAAWARILDTLEAKHVEASFFCTGIYVAGHPVLARRTIEGGNSVGSHGWDHASLTTLPYDEVRSRLVRDQAAWWKTASTTPAPFFRPPGGATSTTVLQAAGSAGYLRTVIWDVDPRDWSLPGSSVIRERVLSAARRGSIVVLHALDQTAAALSGIIDGLRARGLEPVSLVRLFAAVG